MDDNERSIKVSELRRDIISLIEALPRYDVENPNYFIDSQSFTGENGVYYCHDVTSAIDRLILQYNNQQ